MDIDGEISVFLSKKYTKCTFIIANLFFSSKNESYEIYIQYMLLTTQKLIHTVLLIIGTLN